MLSQDTIDRLVRRLYVLTKPYPTRAALPEITGILIALQTARGTKCFAYPLFKPSWLSRWEYEPQVRSVIIYGADYVLRKGLWGVTLGVRAHHQSKPRTLRLPRRTGRQLWALATQGAEAQKLDLHDPAVQRALDCKHMPELEVLHLKVADMCLDVALGILRDIAPHSRATMA